MNFERVKKTAVRFGWPAYRLSQAREAVYGRGISSWAEAAALPAEIRAGLERECPVLSFSPVKILSSKKGGAHKALLSLRDGARIETVLLKPIESHWSVCVSTQVGCPVGCSFCATGKMGFTRNLSAEEIADQPLFWLGWLRKKEKGARIASVVFMGMGEPLLNYACVIDAANVLANPDFLGIGRRHISVSTAGVAPAIEKLARDLPQANLALSLHSADEEKRDALVPLNRKYCLSDLKKSLEEYLRRAGRQVFLEYAVLKGINDTPKDCRLLAEWIKSFGPASYLLHVNLIASNGPMKPSPEDVRALAAALSGAGIKVSVRKSLGSDILAACGQLAT